MSLRFVSFPRLYSPCEETIFNRLDFDKEGELTLQQLVDGAKKDPDFQSRLSLGLFWMMLSSTVTQPLLVGEKFVC